MPTITGRLQGDGAIVDVVLGWSSAEARQLRAVLRPVPPAITARAILDTGAEMTCFDTALVRPLGLPFAGAGLANLPAHGGVTPAAMSHASLTIVHPTGSPNADLVLTDMVVLELSIAAIGYQVLIGRDVLANCRFLYNGPRSRFRLAY